MKKIALLIALDVVVLISIIHVSYAQSPTLTITGFTADGSSMLSVNGGYVLNVNGDPTTNHVLQFQTDSVASETLVSQPIGLYLATSTVDITTLTNYYNARTMPTEYRSYLLSALDGHTEPFAYITTDESNNLQLHDAAQYDIAGDHNIGMVIPDDYPQGTYTVKGTIQDSVENTAPVTFTLIVAGTCDINVNSNLAFGNLNPAETSSDQKITLTNDGTTAETSLMISGNDWSDSAGHTFEVGQTHWALSQISSYETGDNALLSESVPLGKTLLAGESQDVHFMLKIPGGQFPAAYTQQITFTSGC